MFAPSNDAFEHEKVYPGEADQTDKIRFHVGRGSVESDKFKDEMIIKSLLSKRGIRINKYPNGKVCKKAFFQPSEVNFQ